MAALVACAALCGASAAQADITATTITSPGDPSFFYDPTGGAYDGAPDPTPADGAGFTVSGTTNSTDPGTDAVDIDCYHDDGNSSAFEYTLVSDVALNAAGDFSQFVPYADMENGPAGTVCRLRAVPTGTTPLSGLASFAGPRVLLAYLDDDYYYTGGQVLLDYYLFAPQLGAADDYYSAGDDGLDASYLYDPTVFGQLDALGFDGNDAIDNSNVTVDGAQAYLPDYAAGTGGSGVIGVTVSATQNPSNGDMTIDETDPLLICPSADSPCSAGWVSSGVELQRTITQTDNGHIVLFDDHYVSTDGASHQVTVGLENYQYFDGSSGLEYEFPGQSGYGAPSVPGTVAVGSGAPATIYVNNASEPDGSTSSSRGAITYFTPPSQPFDFPYDDVSYFTATYTLTVPAGGSARIGYAYSTEFSQAALEQDVQTALDLYAKPAVAFTAPAAGATVASPTVTVSGTASAGSGIGSVSVDGVAATVSGSTFTASVPLSVGANTLTATLTTLSGATASTSESVTYSQPPAAVTGAASKLKPTSATLAGQVTPGTAAVKYEFEYGTTTKYGATTGAVSVAASTASKQVDAALTGLRPGTTYHYRLVVTDPAGAVDGAARTFKTAAKQAPRALSLDVTPAHDARAPYRFTAAGKLELPAGVSAGAGCGGDLTVTFKHDGRVVFRQRGMISDTCRYSAKASFSADALAGAGAITVRTSFAGNADVAAHHTRTVTVHYGDASAAAAGKVG